jgi:hypothetical protein
LPYPAAFKSRSASMLLAKMPWPRWASVEGARKDGSEATTSTP